ncbi:hypothetical protein B7R22_07490 [Subtercola boreus]|uniref:Glycoside hydrolase family 5 domain-containing protein n=1 Tax=Subtercola boreus TaxID=120213 RepID=A0A3E0VYS4_9MICO|nr:hypothetical protein B7R22_07490 [Subtercola boreus]
MHLTRRSILTTGISAGAVVGAGVVGGGLSRASAAAAAPLAAAAQAAAHVQAQAPARVASFPVGFSLGSNILWGTTTEIDQTLDITSYTGGTIVRLDIMWYWLQPTATTFDWSRLGDMVAGAEAGGLSIFGIILSCPAWAALGGTGPLSTTRPRTAALYAAFAGQLATRYRGRIAAYEIRNEPNGREALAPDPDPVFYAAMVQAAYPAITAADPAATVVAGALGPAPATPIWLICVFLFEFGAGLGLIMQVVVLVVQNSVPATQVGTATSTNNYFREVGSALGVAVFGALFTSSLSEKLLAVFSGAGASAGDASQATATLDPATLNQLPQAIQDQVVAAYADSLAPVFWYLIPFLAVAFVLSLFLPQIRLSDVAGMVARGEAVTGEEAEALETEQREAARVARAAEPSHAPKSRAE